jgi:dihydroorotase
MKSLLFLLTAAIAVAQPSYDLLLKGGHVIDARNQISDVRDVAISGNKIAAVAKNIPASQARAVVDVSSL